MKASTRSLLALARQAARTRHLLALRLRRVPAPGTEAAAVVFLIDTLDEAITAALARLDKEGNA